MSDAAAAPASACGGDAVPAGASGEEGSLPACPRDAAPAQLLPAATPHAHAAQLCATAACVPAPAVTRAGAAAHTDAPPPPPPPPPPVDLRLPSFLLLRHPAPTPAPDLDPLHAAMSGAEADAAPSPTATPDLDATDVSGVDSAQEGAAPRVQEQEQEQEQLMPGTGDDAPAEAGNITTPAGLSAPPRAATPLFGASPRLDDARAMLAELRRCCWVREGYLEERTAAAVVAFCDGTSNAAGAAGGLRRLVAYARAGTLVSWEQAHVLALCRQARDAARAEGTRAIAADRAAAAAAAASGGDAATTPAPPELLFPAGADNLAAALEALRAAGLPASFGLTPHAAASLARWRPAAAMLAALRHLPAALEAHPTCTLNALASALARPEPTVDATTVPEEGRPVVGPRRRGRKPGARAAEDADVALPAGVTPPCFAADRAEMTTTADVAAMAAELHACGWVGPHRLKALSVDRVVASASASSAAWSARAAACALRAFVARVLRERLPSCKWGSALHAAAGVARAAAQKADAAAAAAPSPRPPPPPPQQQQQQQQQQRKALPAALRPLPPAPPRTKARAEAGTPPASSPAAAAGNAHTLLPPGASLPLLPPVARRDDGNQLCALVAALRSAGWVCAGGGGGAGISEHTARRLASWKGADAAALGIRRLVTRVMHPGAREAQYAIGGVVDLDAMALALVAEASEERKGNKRRREADDAKRKLPPPPPPPPPAPPQQQHGQQRHAADTAPLALAQLRYFCRDPSGAVAGPFPAAAFAEWGACGAIAPTLRVWPPHAREGDGVAVADMLAAAARGWW
jgi:hypothetical protein